MGNVTKVAENGFKWIGNTSQFNEDSIKRYNEDSNDDYFLEVVKNYTTFMMIYPFYPKE